MLNDEHVLESLPAYVLGSLEEAEARLVHEHVRGCYLCRRELEAYQKVADQLLLAVPEASPPAELKLRLKERLQSIDVQRPPRPLAWRFPKWLLPAGAFVGLLLIVILAFSTFMLWQRINRAEVLTGPLGMRAIALQNTNEAPGASGFVIISADGRSGVLVVDKLPQLDASREYQLWLVSDATQTSGAVFAVDENGYRGVRITAPQSLLTYSAIEVTIEKADGSDTPTGAQVLTGSLFNP